MAPSSRSKRSSRKPARPAARSSARKAPKGRAPPKRASARPSRSAPKSHARPAPKASARSHKAAKAPPPEPEVVEPPRLGDFRRHVLSLSFLRDGDEFLARLETDGGQITELKNRSLDQLLTLVAGELEDLLE